MRLLRDNQIDPYAEVVIQPGATLALDSHTNSFRNLEMEGGVLDSGASGKILLADTIRANATNETSIIKGHVELPSGNHTFDINGSVYAGLDIQAEISGSGNFTKTGNAALILSADNSSSGNPFVGNISINQGILDVRQTGALGYAVGSTTIAGGNLTLRNVYIYDETLIAQDGDGAAELPGAALTVIGNATWSGPILLNTNLTVVGGDLILLEGPISGPGGLGCFSLGTMTLGSTALRGTNANTYTGKTLVRCPLLQLNKPSGVKAFAGALEVGGGAGGTCEVKWLNSYQCLYAGVTLFENGQLILNDFNEDLGRITFNGGRIITGIDEGVISGGAGELGIYGLVTANESATIQGRIGLPAGNHEFRAQRGEVLYISAIIGGSGQLTKTGEGGLRLTAANTYAGLTYVNEGWLEAENANALGASADAGTFVADGATLELSNLGATPMPERISIQGRGLDGHGALLVDGTVQLRNQFPGIYAGLDLTTNATINIVTNANYGTGTLIVDGFVSGSGTLTKIGTGSLVYSNSYANTYTGDTIIAEGTLELRKPNNTLAVPGRLVLGDGDTAGVTRAYQTAGLPSGGTVVVNEGSLLDFNGFNQNLSQLTLNDGGAAQTGAGTLQFSGGGSINVGTTTGTLRKGASITGKVQLPALDTLYCNVTQFGIGTLTTDPELAIAAVISGTGNLVKNGGGALRLTGANTFDGTTSVYSGEVDVLDGTLIAGSATALGGINGATYVANGASLALINGLTFANEMLQLNSTNAAALDNRGGNNVWTGPINLLRNSSISVSPDWELNCSGIISGTGNLTKWGDGTLRFSGSGNNSFNGGTFVNVGTLLLSKTTAVTAVPAYLMVGESDGGAPATARNTTSYQIFGNIFVNSQGVYDVNGQTENTDYLGLNGNARVETGTGSLSLKTGASVAVTPGINTTAIINGNVLMDAGTHVFTVGKGGSTNDLLANALFPRNGVTAGIQKTGPGKMQLTANNTFIGTTTVSEGTLQIGSNQQTQTPMVISGGRLEASIAVGTISFGGNASSSLAPGNGPGSLACGNFNAGGAGGGTLEMELNGTTAGTGYDRLNVTGTVNLTGLKLGASLGFASAVGDSFTIINNDGTDAITGTFTGLAQNGKLYIGGKLFQISYTGGTGNDVVLSRLVTPPPPVLAIEPASTNAVRLRWATNDPPFRLIATTNLTTPDWASVTPAPTVNGTDNLVTNTLAEAEKFYQLVNP